ncbi:Uma2 family endonuclease [Geminocystis sp. GBBB08]|uniref:Uma2 family endonuclease n=1 Tax=Geminocystis sp. GBBB08 TaxID=2604140 RepID=UPI0027E30AFA|nr:Uma2 family endonuclease [Geminocystis sp. GBBB08]MBL1208170.1 Uma2 family endonuclease [Geminocystis sp. GBBB08]
MTLTTYKWTTEHYHNAIDKGIFDGESVELLRGEIIIMSPERELHAYYNTEAGDYLRNLLGNKAKIRDAKPITLPNNSEPEPDIAIVKPLGKEYLKHHPYPEDIFWIIEFSQTTLNQDLGEKKDIYAQSGILEYWVVDLKNSQLKVFRDLKNNNYTSELTLTTGIINPLSFPQIIINVEQLMC